MLNIHVLKKKTVMNDKKKKNTRKTTYDKPVSLTGASFDEVVGALLKTPKPEKKESKEKGE